MRLPAAVSPLTRELVLGSPRVGVAAAVFPTAVYLRLDDDSGAGAVLPVVTADALLLPTAVRLAVSSGQLSWPVASGGSFTVGDGRVTCAGLDVRAVRGWRPSRVSAASTLPDADLVGQLPEVAGLGDPCRRIVEAALEEDLDAALEEDRDVVDRGVAGLVGAGAGLTPSGDDALCGLLLALRAWGALAAPGAPGTRTAAPGASGTRTAAPGAPGTRTTAPGASGTRTTAPGASGTRTTALATVAESVARHRHRTTDLSAGLLSAAADGYAVPQVVGLVSALSTGDPGSVRARLDDTLAIGHSSGRDLVTGVAATIRTLLPDRDRTDPDRDRTDADRACTDSDRECASSHRSPSLTPEGTTRA